MGRIYVLAQLHLSFFARAQRASMPNKFFIQSAIKHPGALKRYAKRHHESTGRAIKQGLKSKNATLRKRANLAKTLAKLRKRKR